MKLFLKFIKISNFLSISTASIDLQQAGYTSIEGINNNLKDNSSSNGSGKSTITEAIFWVLTGSTIRGIKDVTNIYGDDGAYVELWFTVDNNKYKVVRTKGHSKLKTNLLVEINGEDKSGKGIKDSQKLLSEYLPDLTAELLGSVIILGQGLPQKFTNNSPSGRKDLLEKLSKSEFMLEDLKNRINGRKDQLSESLRHSEDSLVAANSKITVLNQQISMAKAALASLQSPGELQTAIDSATADISLAKEQLSEIELFIETLTKQLETPVAQKEQLNLDLAQMQTGISKLDTENANTKNAYTIEESQLKEKYSSKISEVRATVTGVKSTLAAKQQELTKLRNVKDVCPTCGQKLPGVYRPDTSEVETEIAQLEAQIQELNTQGNNLIAEMKEAIAELQMQYAPKFEQNTLQKAQIQTKIGDLTNKISETNLEITKIKEQLNSQDSLKRTAQKQIEIRVETLNELEQKKATLETRKATEEATVKNNTEEIEQTNTDIIGIQANIDTDNVHLDIIKKFQTCIQRDFRGQLLVNVIDYMNTEANRFAKIVFGTKGSVEIKLDGNNIDVYLADRIYESLSGGEKQKLDIIVQFTIRSLLCAYNNFSTNCLFLDEIFDGLDAYSTQRVLDLVSTQLSDVESVYIISHHNDLQIPTDHTIVVTKSENCTSTIEQR